MSTVSIIIPRDDYTATELGLDFDSPDAAQMDGLNIFAFFDAQGRYLGPCPVTGRYLLLHGQPIAEGQQVPGTES